MKAEYDLTKLRRVGHPLQAKIDSGELKPISIFDIPNREEKLAALDPDEREFILELFARKSASELNKPLSQAL
ncbi:MAG: hypothetical protein FWC16_14100 [Defluviitaleaceae bacterium]|nr:hypothetical protein [Defluviitaleaceae bacterium]MCL2276045.1 hypothetical protein [Defluviitaleaceae bacterium]